MVETHTDTDDVGSLVGGHSLDGAQFRSGNNGANHYQRRVDARNDSFDFLCVAVNDSTGNR